jgi:glucans biosynthesis protein C
MRCYLTNAIFPFYIIHILTVVVGGYYLTKLELDVVRLEYAMLIYEIARLVSWLRPWFGLKRIGKPGVFGI